MESATTSLAVTEPLAAWLDRADSLEEVARTNQLRQLVSVLRDAVVSAKVEFAPDHVQVRSVDGIVFAAECVEGGPADNSALAFGRLLLFVLTRRDAKSRVDWLRQRDVCGLLPAAIGVLDECFVHPSHSLLGEVDLCPSELYVKPLPVAEKPKQEEKQEEPQEEEEEEEEEQTEATVRSSPVAYVAPAVTAAAAAAPSACAAAVPIVPLCKSFKQRWGTLIAIAGLVLFVYGIGCGFARVQDERVQYLQLQLVRAQNINAELKRHSDRVVGENSRLKREVDRQIYLHARSESECMERSKLAQQRAQVFENGNAELATRLATLQHDLNKLHKKRQSESSCQTTVAQLERQIADLQSRVDFSKLLQQVRQQTSGVFGTVASLWNKHAPDAAAITASYDKLARKVEQLAAKWGSHDSDSDGESSSHRCSCEGEKSTIQVIRGDYDACMNELFRLRSREARE